MNIKIVIIAIVTAISAYLYNPPYDDTDDKANKERSGMELYTDHLTGCQYLKAGLLSGITPRLYSDGKQVCGNAKLLY